MLDVIQCPCGWRLKAKQTKTNVVFETAPTFSSRSQREPAHRYPSFKLTAFFWSPSNVWIGVAALSAYWSFKHPLFAGQGFCLHPVNIEEIAIKTIVYFYAILSRDPMMEGHQKYAALLDANVNQEWTRFKTSLLWQTCHYGTSRNSGFWTTPIVAIQQMDFVDVLPGTLSGQAYLWLGGLIGKYISKNISIVHPKLKSQCTEGTCRNRLQVDYDSTASWNVPNISGREPGCSASLLWPAMKVVVELLIWGIF